MQPQARALCEAAARSYLAAGRYHYHFILGKLRYDPVFLLLLRRGVIPDRARVLDLGCGHGILAALLAAARRQFESGVWPAGWAAPPAQPLYHGIELRPAIAGRVMRGEGVTVQTGDLRSAELPAADVVVILDVLHYLEPDAQSRVLERAAQALRGGGTLLLRVADTGAGARFHLTRLADRLGALLQGRLWPRFFHRPLAERIRLLQDLGFRVRAEPANRGTLFANVLLTSTLPASGSTAAGRACRSIP